MERLTVTQYEALQAEIGFIRYIRDLPQLKYQFAKLGSENWKKMVTEKVIPDPYHDPAWRLFVAPYDLPEYRKRGTHPLALADIKTAIQQRLFPQWALNLLTPEEVTTK